jgi:gamma-D-glutamyl-L-lysine dipeptidyl-peptidase
MKGICLLPLVPLRAEPTEKAEMVSQILYGELLEIIEQVNDWSRVRLMDDHYIGWCTTKMLHILNEEEWHLYIQSSVYITAETIGFYTTKTGKMRLPAGSRLRSLYINLTPSTIPDRKIIELNPSQVARRFLHAPYLWGGKSILGMDCSGLVQVVFQILGTVLPRDAKDQACQGVVVSSVDEAKPGDLAFFENENHSIIHVGIVSDSHQLIHASGEVRLDQLDQQGIFNKTTGTYTHFLAAIKRVR